MAKDPGVHLLHIGKTGGMTLKAVLREHQIRRTADRRPVVIHNHNPTLADVLSRHRKNQAAFFLREPLARFVSGFNSRLRRGQPERDAPWSEDETVVFKYFESANDLGEALSSGRQIVQDRAYFAFGAISHARNRFSHYLRDPDYLQSRIDRLAFIGFQETYAEDVARFLSVLGVGEEIELQHRHRAPETSATDLSRRATRNLRSWYADDIAIYEWALSQRDRFSAERSVELSRADDDVETLDDDAAGVVAEDDQANAALR
jgi:hypothetical protein